jgi:hypothetical protein
MLADFCSNCGAAVAGMGFCPECGTGVTDAFVSRRRRQREHEELSIYEHLRLHLTEADEDEFGEMGVHLAPGAIEGIIAHHTLPQRDKQRVRELHAALHELAERPSERARAHLREALRNGDPQADLNDLFELFRNEQPRELEGLHRELQQIAATSGHRKEVKFAVAMLGGFGQEEDVGLLRTFARHEEFTVYAAIALANLVPDPLEEWMRLSEHVHAWGRVDLVELLLEHRRPDVCAFLLREGFRNDVAYGYTAGLVAEHCDLAGTLERESDAELILGAGEILATLARDAWGNGPAGGLLGYEDGPRAVRRYLELVQPGALADLLSVRALQTFLDDDLAWVRWDGQREQLERRRSEAGWPPQVRRELALTCRRVIQAPEWRELVEHELAEPWDELPVSAIESARSLGIDPRQPLLRYIERDPWDKAAWFHLVHGADGETIDYAVERALKMGIDDSDHVRGESDLTFDGIDFVLEELIRHPGHGWDLLRPALRSPNVRRRRVAVRALSGWPAVSDAQREALAHIAEADPDPELRDEAARALRGERVPHWEKEQG